MTEQETGGAGTHPTGGAGSGPGRDRREPRTPSKRKEQAS
jgi:hypothetical protein